jgi:CysZ protein
MSKASGIDYFFQGFSLIKTKGLRSFVFIPLIINTLLFIGAFYFLFGEIAYYIAYIIGLVPDWLGWIKEILIYLLWPIAVVSVLLIFALIFGTLANWIAAPFNGLLAEKVEAHLTGKQISNSSALDVLKDIPRTLGREFTKLAYYLPRAIGFLILFFLLPVLGQVLWFLFSAWMMSVQYADYPFDNHKVPFRKMKNQLLVDKSLTFSFGIMVNICALIPIVNFIVMPVAICGATAMWVNEHKADTISSYND